ncbi:hypothetical protein QTV49_000475 [Vibrio vulnificus]|nr:hypothetical protein [Vibrio vulnificus]
MSYIKVFVLENKSFGNSSNNGVSVTHFNNLYAEVSNGNVTLEEVQEDNGVILDLVERNIGTETHKHFTPRLESLKGKHLMAGGCFITTPDSRFSRAYGKQPIALHDRVE